MRVVRKRVEGKKREDRKTDEGGGRKVACQDRHTGTPTLKLCVFVFISFANTLTLKQRERERRGKNIRISLSLSFSPFSCLLRSVQSIENVSPAHYFWWWGISSAWLQCTFLCANTFTHAYTPFSH